MGDPGMEEVLPQGCIAHALSLTSPRDACRASAVSTTFLSAAASDAVWDRFLPADLQSVLARADRPVDFSSKRELFFRLCDEPVLLDGGKMIFSLDRSSGAKCYMLSARALSILRGDTEHCWRWVSQSDSRFLEVAELINVCWLEIHGKIHSKILSSKTTYAAYLIFKLSDHAYGLGHPLQEASVKIGTQSSTTAICLQLSDMYAHLRARRRSAQFRQGFCSWQRQLTVEETREAEEEVEGIGGCVPRRRDDGWMEIELGEFYNHGEEDGEEDGEVHIRLLEVKGGHWKNGLIIEGIEIRPKKSTLNQVDLCASMICAYQMLD
ncbi:F-box protein PP2-B11-like [Curcuma longa]|uniref:F-box protein PP2-B11-like n=1 Tax=Curcuma longa TaxID=136217 RepID=UPI003D9DE4D7